MKGSLSFITGTASVSETPIGIRAGNFGPRVMEVLGYERCEQKIYVLEKTRDEDIDLLPQLFTIRAHGWLAGRTTPVHTFYLDEDNEDRPSFNARLTGLRAQLTPLFPVGSENFRLSTRVTRRRAVRIQPGALPVRRYDVRVTVRPVDGDSNIVTMGARKTVTAYLRPRVRLVDVFAHPALEFAVALVSYVGMPYDIGYERQSAILMPLGSYRYQP